MARLRTIERRQAILDHASVIFRACGYDRASMAQIAARVGGSKTTLYGYFPSKQALFLAVMTEAMEAQTQALVALIDMGTEDPRHALRAFGNAYLELVASPDCTSMMRTCIAEGREEAIGRSFYLQGPRHGWEIISQHLQGWMDRGILRDGHPMLVALHLRGLLEAGMIEPILFGTDPEFEQGEAVTAAVDAFFCAHGA